MTNRITSPAVGLLLAMALLLGLAAAPAQAETKIPANLRVITFQGKIIFDGKVKTGSAEITPDTACLGGNPGPARRLEGPTALGLLSQASLKFKALRPLRISDGEWGFGICGIGGLVATGEQWWSLYHNNKPAATGAETLKVKRNDSVLFFLSRTWAQPNPNLLSLKAPAKAKRGKKVRVRVFEHDNAGKRKPARGVKVRGANGKRTNAKGYTRLKIVRKTKLVARKAGLIPSNRVAVSIRK